jgi:hypothetical protein
MGEEESKKGVTADFAEGADGKKAEFFWGVNAV